MELKKRNMINYTGTAHYLLRQGFFNNCIGRYMNKELYYSLGPAEKNKRRNSYKIDQNRVNATQQLAIKYNGARNLGELLVNYSQSEDVNKIVELRTFVYFAANALNQDTSTNYLVNNYLEKDDTVQDVTDEQLKVFYNNVFDALKRQFDFFTAATILQAPKVVEVADSGDINAIAFMLFEELCKLVSVSEEIQKGVKSKLLSDEKIEELREDIMSLEEVIYIIYSLFSCSQMHEKCQRAGQFINEETLVEAAISALDAIELNYTFSSNLEDASIYLMLNYILETVPEIASPKKFKNKKVEHKILKKIQSISTKCIKTTELEEYANLIGISKDMVAYLNYLSYQNLNIMYDKVSHQKSGFGISTIYKIKANLVTILENENFLPPYLLRDINDAVYTPKHQGENPSIEVAKFFVKEYPGTLSKNNLMFVIKHYGLGQIKEFMTDPRWAHLLSDQPNQPVVNNAAQVENKVVETKEEPSTPQTVENMQQVEKPKVTETVQPTNPSVSFNPQGNTQVVNNNVAVNTQNVNPGVSFNPNAGIQSVNPEIAVTTQEVSRPQAVETVQQVNPSVSFNPQGNTQVVNNEVSVNTQNVNPGVSFSPNGNTNVNANTVVSPQQVVNNQPVQNVQPINQNTMVNPQVNVANSNTQVVQNTNSNIVKNYVELSIAQGPISLF